MATLRGVPALPMRIGSGANHQKRLLEAEGCKACYGSGFQVKFSAWRSSVTVDCEWVCENIEFDLSGTPAITKRIADQDRSNPDHSKSF